MVACGRWPMRDEILTDALLREYLLGRVDEADRERIENLFLTDSQARDRILVAEQDLIEDYLEDNLNAEDKEVFLWRFGQTPAQQRLLRINESISDWAIAEAASTEIDPVKSSRWVQVR